MHQCINFVLVIFVVVDVVVVDVDVVVELDWPKIQGVPKKVPDRIQELA